MYRDRRSRRGPVPTGPKTLSRRAFQPEGPAANSHNQWTYKHALKPPHHSLSSQSAVQATLLNHHLTAVALDRLSRDVLRILRS